MTAKRKFIKRLAEYLSDNIAAKSISLQMSPGLVPWPEEWRGMRNEASLVGWTTVEETEAILIKLLS